MCETMQSSHLLSDVLGVEVFFLAPTASGDGAGAHFCVTVSFDSTFSWNCGKHQKLSGGNFWVGTSKIILDLYHVICLVR